MENFSKEQIISYLESNDQEICEAAFGYALRDIVKNEIPLFEVPDILHYKDKIPALKQKNIIIDLGKQLKDPNDIRRFVNMSYWFPDQATYICKVLEDNHHPYLERHGLEILAKLAATTTIPYDCYQYLITQIMAGNKNYQKLLFDKILPQHPDIPLDKLLEAAQQKQWSLTISILMEIVRHNKNEKDLLPILQYIDNCCRRNAYDEKSLQQFFCSTLEHYNQQAPIKISYQIFMLIFLLSNELKIDDKDLKQIAPQLIYRTDNENPLIREKKADLLKFVAKKTKDYPFVLDILSKIMTDATAKRIVLLTLYALMELIADEATQNDDLQSKYKDTVLKFIRLQGKNFDKSDFEYIRNILNQNKADEEFVQSALQELVNNCQKTAVQIDCLLHYSITYKQYSINLLKFIDWKKCPLEPMVLYRLLSNYKNSKDIAEKRAYEQIFAQLSECSDLATDINILLGEIVCKLNFSAEQKKEYPSIAGKIKWYQERQQILEALKK